MLKGRLKNPEHSMRLTTSSFASLFAWQYKSVSEKYNYFIGL